MENGKALEGKVALVTGAGGGIGRMIALSLAKAGAKVVVNDLGVSLDGTSAAANAPAQKVVDEIAAAGGSAIANFGSVTDWDAAQAMVADAVKAFGRLDLVVNNAGILRDTIFHKMGRDDIDAVLDVHLKGAFYVSRAAATQFRAQESGSFIHMSSSSAVIGNFGQANYSAAKMGIVGLSKSIAIDMERFNVRSNVIVPFAWTRMVESIGADNEVNRRRVEQAKKLDPAKIGVFCAALATDAAKHISGQIFGVRNNEIHLFSQMRLLQSTWSRDGWGVGEIVERVFPQFAHNFYPLHRSADIFSWSPA